MYNVIKALNTRRSPDVDLTKIAIVYDTTVAGELELCQAYMTARGIPSTHLYGIALGNTYEGATLAAMRPAFITALGDYLVTHSIEMVAVGPNSPLRLGDRGYQNQGTSLSSICGQAIKSSTLLIGNPLTTWNSSGIYKNRMYWPDDLTNTSEDRLSSRDALEEYNYIEDADELIEIDGVDIEAFQSTLTGATAFAQVAIDQGRVQDINGSICIGLPCFRIGFHKVSNGGVSITEAQITTMVQNSIALANTRAYHKANTNVTVVTNGRTGRITNHSGTYAHYLVEQMGYTNNSFGYRLDTAGNDDLTSIGTNTGIAKYNGTTAEADFNIDKDSSGTTNTTTSRTPNYNGYLYEAHNGTTFPITTGVIIDTACENPRTGGHVNSDIWTTGSGAQIFELEPGAIIQTTTSHGLKVAAEQIANGAGALIGSYYEPGDTGVGNGCDTIQYLMKGYDAATAKFLDASSGTTVAEVWGDGLTQFVNDVPVISNEETRRSLTVPFKALNNATYAITGSYQNTVGEGSMVVNAFDESNLYFYDYKVSGYCDIAAGTMPLISDATVGGFSLIFESSASSVNRTTTLPGPLPYTAIRITDVLEPSRLDRIIAASEFSQYTLGYAVGCIYLLENEFLLEDGRDYTLEFIDATSEKYEVLSYTRLASSTDLAGVYNVNTLVGLSSNGVSDYYEFEDSPTGTYYPSTVVIKSSTVKSSVPALNERNIRVDRGNLSFSTPQPSLSLEAAEEALATAQATLTQTQADLATAQANVGESYDPIANLTVNVPNGGLFVESNGINFLTRSFDEGTWHANDDTVKIDISSAVITSGSCVIVSGQGSGDTTGLQGTLTLENKSAGKAIVVYDVTLS
jgi:hypothetical protein